MIPLTYLNREDRRRLLKLREEQEKPLTPERGAAIFAEIQNIEKRRKNLGECTFDELMDLKSIIYEKYRRIASIGKETQTRQLLMMLQSIDSRLQNMYTEIFVKKILEPPTETMEEEEEDILAPPPPPRSPDKRRGTWITKMPSAEKKS